LSYAVVERKRETRQKVDGGSSIEIVSAGFENGNVGKIILNGKEVLTTRNMDSTVKMQDAMMSSNYRKGDVSEEASLALNDDVNTYFHTKCEADEWWSAQFGNKFLVSEVQITNRLKGDDNVVRRLQKAEITVEGKHCGFLPEIPSGE